MGSVVIKLGVGLGIVGILRVRDGWEFRGEFGGGGMLKVVSVVLGSFGVILG